MPWPGCTPWHGNTALVDSVAPTRPLRSPPPTLAFYSQAGVPDDFVSNTIQVFAYSYPSAFSCMNCTFANNTAVFGSALEAYKGTDDSSTMTIDLTGSTFSGGGM